MPKTLYAHVRGGRRRRGSSLEGRGKLVLHSIYSEAGDALLRLDRAIPNINQKMAGSQSAVAVDGLVVRTSYPRCAEGEYRLTPWGQSLYCACRI